MHLLVTGRSGSGKTTVCAELQKMGLPAFDGDRIEGLADWVDCYTNRRVQIDYSKPVDKRKVQWLWAEPVLRNFLDSHETAVLCGSADNQLQFYPLFDMVIFLSLPADEQVRRIQSRGASGYGIAPGMTTQIVREQAQLHAASEQLGAVIMSADRPPHKVACDISKHVI